VLSLDDAVNAAIAHHPSVAQAVASERASEARVLESRASLLPSILASVTASYSNPIFPGVVAGSSERLVPGVSITETLFDYGAYYRWKAAEANVIPLRTAIEVTDETVALNVRTAYFAVLAAEALVAVNQEQVDNQQKHVDQTQAFVEVGTHPKIDLITAQVNLGNAQLALVQAQNGVQQAKVALRVAIGLTDASDFEVEETELAPLPGEDGNADALLPAALKQRPDVVQLEQQMDAQQLTVHAYHVQTYYPTLSITGSWGYLINRNTQSFSSETCAQPFPTDLPISVGGGGGSFGGSSGRLACIQGVNPTTGALVFDPAAPIPFSGSVTSSTQGNQWSAGATLSWPLYLGGLVKNQEAEQQANLDVLQAQHDSLVLSIRSELEGDLIAIANDKQQIALSQSTVEQAREQLELANGRYQAGVGNIIELGDAEAAVANAEGQLVKARYALATDRAKLAKAVGQ
jgi:outer membrane protein